MISGEVVLNYSSYISHTVACTLYLNILHTVVIEIGELFRHRLTYFVFYMNLLLACLLMAVLSPRITIIFQPSPSCVFLEDLYIRQSWSTMLLPVLVPRELSLSSSLLKQCPANLVLLIRILRLIFGRLQYSSSFVVCCLRV